MALDVRICGAWASVCNYFDTCGTRTLAAVYVFMKVSSYGDDSLDSVCLCGRREAIS